MLPMDTSSQPAAALVACVLLSLTGATAQDLVTVHPVDTGAALHNPAMGWVFHHYDNSIAGYGAPLGPAYDGSEFPGLTVVYLRLAWSYLEPEEGKFNWSVVDTPAQRYIGAGKKIAFRITCYEGSDAQPYATPKWVRDAGAKGYDIGNCWEPDYDDPVYLDKLDAFLRAFGARYDGDPGVAFVDIGTLGIWGEGHPIARNYTLATAKRHIDLHRKYLPNTLLAVGDDFASSFADGDLTTVGTARIPVAFRIPDEARGRSYPVFAGLWIPEDKTRPDARLLPSNGDPDRRVPIGEVSIAADGEASFTPQLRQSRPGGDFEITSAKAGQADDEVTLHLIWDIRTDNPGNVRPYCHLDAEGKIAIGGGRQRDTAIIDYARSQGLTLRDDSILVQAAPRALLSAAMAQPFWPTLPVILESGHYGYAKRIDAWGDGSEYLRAVEEYHGSYVSIHAHPVEFLEENRELIRRMNLRMGYRLNLREVSWPQTASCEGPLTIVATWANAGVAPCYPGGHPTWWLFDEAGNLMAALVDEGFDMRDLQVGPPGEAPQSVRERSFLLPPGLPTGQYELLVSVGDATGTPRIALPLEGDDGRMRYRLGQVELR